MPCTPFSVPTPDGGRISGFICSRGRRQKPPPPCACGAPSTKLCDGRVPGSNRRTRACNRPLCDACAHPLGGDRDHCPDCHAAAAPPGAPDGALVAYVDGSGTTAERPCGAGVVIYDGPEVVIEAARHLGPGTNNHAELSAIRVALYLTSGPEHRERLLIVRSDSTYAIGAAGGDGPIDPHTTNGKLIAVVRRALVGRRVRFEHVKGHTGVAGNERADELANRGRLGKSPLGGAA